MRCMLRFHFSHEVHSLLLLKCQRDRSCQSLQIFGIDFGFGSQTSRDVHLIDEMHAFGASLEVKTSKRGLLDAIICIDSSNKK